MLIGQTPPARFELATWKLTVSRATAAPQGNGLENKSPTGTEGFEPPTNRLEVGYSILTELRAHETIIRQRKGEVNPP